MPRETNCSCNELAGERDGLCAGELARQGELNLAGELRVLALLRRLDLVPQHRAISPALRRTSGQQDLRVDDVGLAREIVRARLTLIGQRRRRAVGRGRHRAAPARPRDHLSREVIDRHVPACPRREAAQA